MSNAQVRSAPDAGQRKEVPTASVSCPGHSSPRPSNDVMREAIVLGARALFAAKGYERSKMSEIAAACQMSTANLYNYFNGKQAIGIAVVATYIDGLHARIEALRKAPPASAEEHMRSYIRIRCHFVIQSVRQQPHLVELAELVFSEDAAARAIVTTMQAEHLGELAAIISKGAKTGEFAAQDPSRAANSVFHALRYFHIPFAMSRLGLDTAEIDLEAALDLVCAGLKRGV